MQEIEHTRLLVHSIESIGRAVELKELLQKSMDAIRTVLRSEASSLMLLDESTGELNVSIPTGPVKEEITGFAIPKNKGIGGWVIQHNQEYLSNDISEDDVFWKDISANFETRNILCVPLKNRKGEAYGVLQALNKEHELPFHQEDIEVFKILSEHISLAIQRNREFDEMESKLKRQTLLLSETHHRLKNNLFAISALIELESNGMHTIGSDDILKKASTRLKSIAHLHSMLYENANSNEVKLRDFIEDLIKDVSRIYDREGKEIRIGSDIDDIVLPADLCVLCGLTLNELLINAYKHAFEQREYGEINIRVRNIANEKIIMNLSDDGVGMSYSEKKKNHMFVVNAFVSQMDASLLIKTDDKGTNFTIEIPL